MDFWTSALLKALKSTFFALKKADGQAFRGAEAQKSARNFSYGLDFKLCVWGSKELKKDAGELFWPLAQSLQLHYS